MRAEGRNHPYMQQYVPSLHLLLRTPTQILSWEQWRSTGQGILLSDLISHITGRDGHKQTNEIPEDIHSPDQFLLHKPHTRTLSLKHTDLVPLYCQNNADKRPLKADSRPSRQNIHCLEWNLKTQYCVHHSPLLDLTYNTLEILVRCILALSRFLI
jgi:hypothetical protein